MADARSSGSPGRARTPFTPSSNDFDDATGARGRHRTAVRHGLQNNHRNVFVARADDGHERFAAQVGERTSWEGGPSQSMRPATSCARSAIYSASFQRRPCFVR